MVLEMSQMFIEFLSVAWDMLMLILDMSLYTLSTP